MSFEQGLYFHQQGALSQAIELYQRSFLQHPRPETAYNLGLAFAGLYNWKESEAAYRKALELKSDYGKARNNLALALQKQGKLFDAEWELRVLVIQDPDNMDAQINLGGVLYDQGRPNDAASVLYPVLKPQKHHPIGWFLLGISLRDMGQTPEAIGCLHRSHQQDPGNAETLLELGGLLLAYPEKSLHCFQTGLERSPGHNYLRFQLAVLYEILDKKAEASSLFSQLPADVCKPWLDSWAYVRAHKMPETRFLGSQIEMLQYASQCATKHRLVLELGVRFGTSLRYIQQQLNCKVHGFDSFQGLPIDWHEVPQGAYSTDGQIPDLGPNIQLYPGWFRDTLPSFVDQNPDPIKLLHIDCDLYESTIEALDVLAPQIQPGTLVLFDEYIMNIHWRLDEYRAWQESVSKQGWSYEYLAFGMLSHQALVRIT